MSRKDYQLIASVLNNTHQKDKGNYVKHLVVERLARDIAIALAKDNPHFNEGKFLEACWKGTACQIMLDKIA